MIPTCKLQIEHCKLQRILPLIALLVVVAADGRPTLAADPKPPSADKKPPATERLLDRTPFDQIVLNAGWRRQNARSAAAQPAASRPGHTGNRFNQSSAPRSSHGRIRSLLGERCGQSAYSNRCCSTKRQRLTAAGKFDDAYDYYARLGAEFPSLANLNDADLRLPAAQRARALSGEATRPRARPFAYALPTKSELRGRCQARSKPSPAKSFNAISAKATTRPPAVCSIFGRSNFQGVAPTVRRSLATALRSCRRPPSGRGQPASGPKAICRRAQIRQPRSRDLAEPRFGPTKLWHKSRGSFRSSPSACWKLPRASQYVASTTGHRSAQAC